MGGFTTLGQRHHTKVPRTNNCISNVNRRTDRQTEWGVALSQIGWLGAKKKQLLFGLFDDLFIDMKNTIRTNTFKLISGRCNQTNSITINIITMKHFFFFSN